MTEAIMNVTPKSQNKTTLVSCRIIGVLDDGINSLTAKSLNYIKQADVIIGASRTLKLFESIFSDSVAQYDLTGKLSSVPGWIEAAQKNKQQVIVLATGDPLCHGIAKYISEKINFENCEIYPNVSTIQLACARIGLSWQDLKICSVHTIDTGEWLLGMDTSHGLYHLLQLTQHHNKLAIFTSPDNSPDRIARMLLLEGFKDDFNLTVVENILQNNENIIGPITIAEAAKRQFSDVNIVILQRCSTKKNYCLFGSADHLFKQRKPDKGLITKREVRAVSLARMQLQHNSIVWDIGAGSGSVGLEAARLCRDGHVYAIEKNSDDFSIAHQNKQDMRITNYTLVNAKAPEQLDCWPDPDAIFIGGSGGELNELISLCITRMHTNACLVMNFVTIENLATAVESLKKLKTELATNCTIEWDVTQLSAARSKPILHMNRFQAENPVWIVTTQKEALDDKN
ncbi:MAG: precorrin-6y C5,15-methyltransferase (decarboxylating) subunit CbiE [Gammaproteobacteria bacterium]